MNPVQPFSGLPEELIGEALKVDDFSSIERGLNAVKNRIFSVFSPSNPSVLF